MSQQGASAPLPRAREDADPLQIGDFRRRLVRAVVGIVVVLTLTATGLSIRLSDTVSREREAVMLSSLLARDGRGQPTTAEDLAQLVARSVRMFERQDAGGAVWQWGFFDQPEPGAWAAVLPPEGTPQLLVSNRPGNTPEMVETGLIRLLFGGSVLAWLTFWAGLLVTQRATSRLQESAGQLLHAWTHDGQTGLMTRDRLVDVVDGSGGTSHGALLVVPLLDHTEHHDTLGPDHADAVLAALVDRLQTAVPKTASVGRTATDCLTAWVPGMTEEAALDVAEALHGALHQPVDVAGFTVLPTTSVGVALQPRDGDTARDLLARAGRASRSGEALAHGVAAYRPEMEADQERHLWMRPLLRSAMESGSITLAFQPKVDARTGRIRGAEALARWTDPERGPIRPDHFIAVAEQSGQIHLLTRQLLDLAADQAARLRDLGHDCPIAMNLSALCVADEGLIVRLREVIEARGLTPGALDLEITETAAVVHPNRARSQLEQLRALGFHVAMDDFGTGQSSLAQLGSLPIDDVKIDQAFIRPLDPDAPSGDLKWRLVEGIIRLAESLERTTTAEGVESRAVGERLAALGCTTLQGWAYSRAVPGPDLEALLAAQSVRPSAEASVASS